MEPLAVPVVVYAAKSTADEHDSVDSQVTHVREAIERVGGRRLVAEPLTETAVSGYRKSRGPALEAAIAVAKKHAPAELWVFHSSRLARGSGKKDEARSLGEVFHDCRRAGVTLRSVEDDTFITSKMLVGIADEQNEKYSADLGAHVRRGKRRQLEDGRRIGGPVPDGYVVRVRRDEHDKVIARTYHRDPGREAVIARLFALASDGLTPSAIARAVNQAGLRSARGAPFTRARVAATLRNPFYAGGIAHLRGAEDERVNWNGGHDPYITRSEHDKLQPFVAQDPSRRGGRRPKSGFALAKLAVCDRCGGRMFAYTSPYTRNDGTRQRAYVCGSAHVSDGTCGAPKVPASVVDAAVVRHLNVLFLDFDAWVTSRAEAGRSRRVGLEAELAVVLKKAATAEDVEAKLLAAYTAAVAREDPAARAALVAYEAHLGQRDASQARVRELQEALAAAPEVEMDEALDFWNRLARAVRGGGGEEVLDLNDRLRAVFVEFRLGVVDEGATVGILPVLREDVVERYADAPPVAYGSGGVVKPAPDLPAASPLVVFASGDESAPLVETGLDSWKTYW